MPFVDQPALNLFTGVMAYPCLATYGKRCGNFILHAPVQACLMDMDRSAVWQRG